jgi:hypothetical protein
MAVAFARAADATSAVAMTADVAGLVLAPSGNA